MLKLTLLLTLLIPFTTQAQEQKKEPERLHCKVMSIEPDEHGVDVVVLGDCANQEGEPLLIKRLRAPAGLNLKDKHLNPQVSTVVLERTANELCLVQVNLMGGFTKEPVNQKHECVTLKKPRNHKSRRKGETR